MIGILLIYFIGKAFYDLAKEFDKSKWGYAVLGVVAYYGGAFVAGIILGILDEFAGLIDLDSIPDLAVNLMAIPIGLLSCWLLHKYLKRRWGISLDAFDDAEVLDSGLVGE